MARCRSCGRGWECISVLPPPPHPPLPTPPPHTLHLSTCPVGTGPDWPCCQGHHTATDASAPCLFSVTLQGEWDNDRQGLPAITGPVFLRAVFELVGECKWCVCVGVCGCVWAHAARSDSRGRPASPWLPLPPTDQWSTSVDAADYIAFARDLAVECEACARRGEFVTKEDDASILAFKPGRPPSTAPSGRASRVSSLVEEDDLPPLPPVAAPPAPRSPLVPVEAGVSPPPDGGSTSTTTKRRKKRASGELGAWGSRGGGGEGGCTVWEMWCCDRAVCCPDGGQWVFATRGPGPDLDLWGGGGAAGAIAGGAPCKPRPTPPLGCVECLAAAAPWLKHTLSAPLLRDPPPPFADSSKVAAQDAPPEPAPKPRTRPSAPAPDPVIIRPRTTPAPPRKAPQPIVEPEPAPVEYDALPFDQSDVDRRFWVAAWNDRPLDGHYAYMRCEGMWGSARMCDACVTHV
jgi:hypothetical protein